MRLTCPYSECGQIIEIDESCAGEVAVCPSCGQQFQCPAMSGARSGPPPLPTQPTARMKLTINRTEREEGLIFKKIIYILETVLELSIEELEIVKKHGWDKSIFAEGTLANGVTWTPSMRTMLGRKELKFSTIEHLNYFEKTMIENARQLKTNIESIQNGYISGGPREVDL